MQESALSLPAGRLGLDWATLSIQGPDAADFLNRLTTLSFKNWDPSAVRLGAFLTARSGVVALGFFRAHSDGFYFCVPQGNAAAALEHLERYHFAENLEFKDVSTDWRLFARSGVVSVPGLEWNDPFSRAVSWCHVPMQEVPAPEGHFTEQWLNYYLVSVGFARVGVEIDSTVMVLEAGLEKAVDRNKGCYPGQEVVERIFTYGQVNRKLFPVEVRGEYLQGVLPLEFVHEGKKAAVLQSIVPSPEKDRFARGLAFVYRNFWDGHTKFQAGGVEIELL